MGTVVKDQIYYVPISTFGSAGSFGLVGGSAYVTEAASNTKYAAGVTLTTSSVETGVSKIAINTNASTLYERGKTFWVWLNSASVDGQMINAVVGEFEVDTHTLARTSVTSANASVMTLQAGIDADNRHVGCTIRVIDGSARGSPAHAIVSSESSGNRVKIAPAFGQAPNTGDRVEILATEFIEDLEDIPANINRVASVTVSAAGGFNFGQFWNNSNTSVAVAFTVDDLRTDVAAILADTEQLSADCLQAVNDAFTNQFHTEPTAAPTWTMSMRDMIRWSFMRGYSQHRQSSTSVSLYSSAGTLLASASTSFTSTSARTSQWLND